MSNKLALLLFFPLLAGCKSQPAKPAEPMTTETYTVKGKVVSTNPQTTEVTLDHEAIPGFMEAMTMPYKVEDPSVLKELHPGDKIKADLLVEKDKDGEYHHGRLAHILILAQMQPDYKPTVTYNTPSKGQPVPDFRLTNQDGKPIHMDQYKGKALLITFIYTRCPLADFCPKMSRNFATIDAELKKDKELYAHTHLLSISFDPAYDSPKVLKSYGEAVSGEYTKAKFDHWDFAAPNQADLAKLEQFFQVGVTPGDSRTLNHSLSTILIGKDGKIAAWYPGGDWKPEDVVKDMKAAA